MSSEQPMEGPETDPMSSFGRTGWDILYIGRYVMLICIIIAIAGVILYVCRESIDGASVLQFMDVYWPVFFSPLAGWFVGKYAVSELYKPTGVIVHVFYPQYHILRLVFVPDTVFKTMEQEGNSVVYRTPGGQPVYLAKHMDIAEGRVDFGMIHSVPAVEAMTYEEGFCRWREESERAERENIILQTYPEMIAAGLTRRSVKEVLDMFAKALKHTDADYTDVEYEGEDDGGEIDVERQE